MKTLFTRTACLIAGLVVSGAALAQAPNFPNKSVSLMVPYPAGGSPT